MNYLTKLQINSLKRFLKNINIIVSYTGRRITIGKKLPDTEEILENKEGIKKMSSYLVSQYPDKIKITELKGMQRIFMNFKH